MLDAVSDDFKSANAIEAINLVNAKLAEVAAPEASGVFDDWLGTVLCCSDGTRHQERIHVYLAV